MGDLTGSSILNMLGTMGSAINKPLDAASGFVIGPHENVPWGEQAARLAAGILLPQQLHEFQRDWRHQDAAQAAEWADPQVQALLGQPGGEDVIRQSLPGFRPPPARDVGDVRASSATNTVAVPSKPGDPTTKAYQLPLTPNQLATGNAADLFDRLQQNFNQLQYEGSVTVGPKGPQVTFKERSMGDVAVPRDVVEGTNYRALGFQLDPTNRVDGRGVPIVLLKRDPAAEAGKAKYETGVAERETRLGLPHGAGGALPGTDELDVAKARDTNAITAHTKTTAATRKEERAIADQMQKVRSAREQLDVLKNLVLGPADPESGMREGGPLRQEPFTGVGDRAAYALKQGAKLLGGDQQLRDIERTKKILRSSLAKAMADQTGNLAIEEQEAIEQATSGSYDTIPSATSNFAILDQLLAAKERAIQEGRVLTKSSETTAPPTPGYDRSALEAEARRRGLLR